MKVTLDRLATGLRNYLGVRPQAVAALEDERAKARLSEVQRRLRIYLRALWDCDFIVKPAEVDPDEQDAVIRPYVEYGVIHLPELYYDCTSAAGRAVTGLETYRAAAAHAAAHLIYSGAHWSRRAFDKRQIALISTIEDARIEALAIRSFPGLKQAWLAQHSATPRDEGSAGHYLDRLARALLDESYGDDDPWIMQGREWFGAAEDLEDEQLAQTLGLRLAEALRSKNMKFGADADMSGLSYRDDNRFLWRRPGKPLEIINPYIRSKSAVGLDDGDKKPKERPTTVLDEFDDDKPVYGTFYYPEWNYRSQSEDKAWVTLRERSPVVGDLAVVERIAAENSQLILRMKALLRAVRDGTAHRVRKLEDGDEIDINAAIRAQIDMRLGVQPDQRIMMRSLPRTRDISVLMLLDLSRSMNDKVEDREHTALQLTQQVSVLFAEAIAAVGDPFAIHGFYSDSRHFVEYFRIKDFGQSYDEGPKAGIAGMIGQRGTRMGAAVRHATHHLNEQKSGKKILLIITDGEPSDVDAPDRKYLHDDTKKAVEDAKREGIHTYCISLDPAADEYVSRIFGAMNYMVVDHVRRLPEKVLLIYAGLTRK